MDRANSGRPRSWSPVLCSVSWSSLTDSRPPHLRVFFSRSFEQIYASQQFPTGCEKSAQGTNHRPSHRPPVIARTTRRPFVRHHHHHYSSSLLIINPSCQQQQQLLTKPPHLSSHSEVVSIFRLCFAPFDPLGLRIHELREATCDARTFAEVLHSLHNTFTAGTEFIGCYCFYSSYHDHDDDDDGGDVDDHSDDDGHLK